MIEIVGAILVAVLLLCVLPVILHVAAIVFAVGLLIVVGVIVVVIVAVGNADLWAAVVGIGAFVLGAMAIGRLDETKHEINSRTGVKVKTQYYGDEPAAVESRWIERGVWICSAIGGVKLAAGFLSTVARLRRP